MRNVLPANSHHDCHNKPGNLFEWRLIGFCGIAVDSHKKIAQGPKTSRQTQGKYLKVELFPN